VAASSTPLFSVTDDIISISGSGSSSCPATGSVDVTSSSLLDKSAFSSSDIIVNITDNHKLTIVTLRSDIRELAGDTKTEEAAEESTELMAYKNGDGTKGLSSSLVVYFLLQNY
jgi:hypothetical protein